MRHSNIARSTKSMCTTIGCALMFIVFFLPAARSETTKPLTICVDIGGMDSEKKNELPKNLFTGPRIGIILEVFRRASIPVQLINDGPWKRCLNDVAVGHIDFAMGAYYDDERAKLFDFSEHYNTLSPTIFFLASRNLKIEKVEDLEKLHGCGISGYSYAHYGIRTEVLDWTPDYGSIYRKLIAGHCDFILEELESIFDGGNANQFLNNPLITHIPAEWAISPSSYIITKKNGKLSGVLKEFNQSLELVIKSGDAARIWKEGMGDLPYKP